MINLSRCSLHNTVTNIRIYCSLWSFNLCRFMPFDGCYTWSHFVNIFPLIYWKNAEHIALNRGPFTNWYRVFPASIRASKLGSKSPIQSHNNSQTHVTASAVFIGHLHRKPDVFMNVPSYTGPSNRGNIHYAPYSRFLENSGITIKPNSYRYKLPRI